jgi:hypothetical protein
MRILATAAAVLGLLPALIAASTDKDSRREQPVTAEARQLRQAWMAEATNHLQSMAFADERLRILRRLLRSTPKNIVQSEYNRLCSNSLAVSRARALDYDRALLECFVSVAVEERNGEKLTCLLTMNCPYAIGFQPTEFYMATAWKEGILILFESFSNSHSQEARQAVMQALRRAFNTQHAEFKDDAEFVARAKRWFLQNRGRLKVNPDYPHLGQRPAFPEPQVKDLFLITER